MNLGVAWEGSPASKVCEERTYYESLVGVFRASKRVRAFEFDFLISMDDMWSLCVVS